MAYYKEIKSADNMQEVVIYRKEGKIVAKYLTCHLQRNGNLAWFYQSEKTFSCKKAADIWATKQLN